MKLILYIFIFSVFSCKTNNTHLVEPNYIADKEILNKIYLEKNECNDDLKSYQKINLFKNSVINR